jgi:hypothetical protein
MRGRSTICAFIRSKAISSLGFRLRLQGHRLKSFRNSAIPLGFESPGLHDCLTWLTPEIGAILLPLCGKIQGVMP